MKYAFIKAHRSELSVTKMCNFLEVSRSGFHDWENRKPSHRTVENKNLLEEIRAIHRENRFVYGSPRITDELNERRKEHEKIGENRVARIMQEAGISGQISASFKVQTTDSDHDFPISPNLLAQDFLVDRPNETWLSDITYIRTGEGFGFLCAIKDLFDETIVGWSFANHLRADLLIEAFRRALFNRQPGQGLIFHSDRGVQYASDSFRKELKLHKFRQSMSRKGNCYDNAPMESFFARLKVEEVYRNKYRTIAEARRNLFDYIDGFYNRKRKHSRLGYLSPIEYLNA